MFRGIGGGIKKETTSAICTIEKRELTSGHSLVLQGNQASTKRQKGSPSTNIQRIRGSKQAQSGDGNRTENCLVGARTVRVSSTATWKQAAEATPDCIY